jgi:transposase
LLAGEVPESWIPPAHMLELRTRVRMRKALVDDRTAWQQRLKGAGNRSLPWFWFM